MFIEFHSNYDSSCRKIDFLTNLSKFYAFVQFFPSFGQLIANS